MKKRKQFIQLLSIAVLLFAFATACDKTDDPEGGSSNPEIMKDIDGNKYKTVRIGSQIWMAENLKTTKYNDGTPIPFAAGPEACKKQESGAYCNYANNETMADTYGHMYNGHVAESGRISPAGWHVPNVRDWMFLREYLISNGFNYDGSNVENKIAKSLCSKISWDISDSEGSPGFKPENNNSTGFSALAGGGRFHYGVDIGPLGETTSWWDSSSDGWEIQYNGNSLNHTPLLSYDNISYIRLIKDNDEIEFEDISIDSINFFSAKIRGKLIVGTNISSFGLCIGTSPNLNLQNSDTVIIFNDAVISFDEEFFFPSGGDNYYIKAFATNNFGTKYSSEKYFSLLPIEPSYKFEDIDRNIYNTVTIGNQVWSIENLKTTRYNDGTPIPNVTDDDEWSDLTTGAYCNYDNLESNAEIYGRLYNWHAVNTGKLAPAGWHVPTDDDWTILENYLIANGYNYDGTKDVDKVAKSLCAKTNWALSSVAGTPGAAPENNNSTGFAALPGGYRDRDNGAFYHVGKYGRWWSSTEYYDYDAHYRFLYYFYEVLGRGSSYKDHGFSVRLVRD